MYRQFEIEKYLKIRNRNSMETKVEGTFLNIFTMWNENTDMELIEEILSDSNLAEAIKRVKSNKGVPGVDKMSVDEFDEYFLVHRIEIKQSILDKKYKPQPVKRVYIPNQTGRKDL